MQIIEGELKPDGTIVLDGEPGLPPGRVRVTVQPVAARAAGAGLLELMERIWADQAASGFVPRTADQVEAERQEIRDEWEEKMREVERIHEESRKARQPESGLEREAE